MLACMHLLLAIDVAFKPGFCNDVVYRASKQGIDRPKTADTMSHSATPLLRAWALLLLDSNAELVGASTI